MLLSRAKPASATHRLNPQAQGSSASKKGSIPSLEDFLRKRDYVGGMTLLDFERSNAIASSKQGASNNNSANNASTGTGGWSDEDEMRFALWYGYCAFHAGNYSKALQTYEGLLQNMSPSKPDSSIQVYAAVCQFYLGLYDQSQEIAAHAPSQNRLAIRLLFHLAQKIGDESKLMNFHQKLQDVVEDQMTLASIHYMRTHYQEAIDVYKRLLLEHREYLAINVYVALCYYRLEYYDVSQEVLAPYLQSFPSSFIAQNLKACIHYKLYNGRAAEDELKALTDLLVAAGRATVDSSAATGTGGPCSVSFANAGASSSGASSNALVIFGEEVIKHNIVVFRGGEGALQILPGLVDAVPEARINLVIYHLKNDDTNAAYELLKDVEPSNPIEYILKGIVNAALGQEQESKEHLKIAQQYFQLVGSSATECDTIPGRQCMACAYFLQRQFDDVLVYLNSIKSYFHTDDNFSFNLAQAKIGAATLAGAGGDGTSAAADDSAACWEEGEELLLSIRSDHKIRDIMRRKAIKAWEMFLTLDTSSESYQLLLLIANECFKTQQYLVALRAFDSLERLDPGSPENFLGKKQSILLLLNALINSSTGALNSKANLPVLMGGAGSTSSSGTGGNSGSSSPHPGNNGNNGISGGDAFMSDVSDICKEILQLINNPGSSGNAKDHHQSLNNAQLKSIVRIVKNFSKENGIPLSP